MKRAWSGPMLAWLATGQAALLPRITTHAATTTRGGVTVGRHAHPPSMDASAKVVPLESLNPSPMLAPREVISSVMAALHMSNWDSPTAFYGFEVALKFLAPTHAAKLRRAKPAGFSRYLRQPHKISQIEWNEYRFEGEVVMLTGAGGTEEAYQMVSMRSSPTVEWGSSRWKLTKVGVDFGEGVAPSQWMVEAVYSNEPDTPEDIEYLRSKPAVEASPRAIETPRDVVERVMRALRHMDAPYRLHGAEVATRYCSPRNRASELSPEMFAGYLQDPWYSILSEWDEMTFDDDDDDDSDDDDGSDDDDAPVGEAQLEVLVRREGEEAFTMVSWMMSQHDECWLIDSLNIIS